MSPLSVCEFLAAIVARYVPIKNVLFRACTSLDLLSFFNWLRIPKTLPFLFLPHANLNPDFQKCLAFLKFPSYAHVSWKPQTTHASFYGANTTHFAPGHGSYMTRIETHWYRTDDKTVIRWRHNADPVPNVCTNYSYESSGGSVGGTATY